MTARLALLLGLFVVPLVLLVLGHRLRDRGERHRAAFWGGVIGHSIAMWISVAALHYPPVLWSTQTRLIIAFWSMLIGGAAGIAIGALLDARGQESARSARTE